MHGRRGKPVLRIRNKGNRHTRRHKNNEIKARRDLSRFWIGSRINWKRPVAGKLKITEEHAASKPSSIVVKTVPASWRFCVGG
jgi:hypothetical protein